MNNNFTMNQREATTRRTGLMIAIVALLVLLVLAAYRMPLFHNELDGIIVGISEAHDETGSELVAAVQLDAGDQVLVVMPAESLQSESNNVRVMEMSTLSGRKTYRIITHQE
jgi:hypothetical protein